MGVLQEIRQKGYVVREVRVVNERGERVAGFSADIFDRVARGHFVSIPRGDLAASIYGKIEGKVETIFGESIDHLEQTERGVQVAFEHGGGA